MNGLFMTVEGVVGTEPRRAVWNGTPVLSFRMVAKERRYDNLARAWVDSHSSWVTVSCWRSLASNVAASIHKGDRLIVHGKVKIKDYVTEAGQQRTNVDVEATSIGHDLKFGTARFRPTPVPENIDDRLREQADVLMRQLDEMPQEDVADLLAQRASLAEPEDDGLDELEEELDDDDFSLEEEGDRRGPLEAAGAPVGR